MHAQPLAILHTQAPFQAWLARRPPTKSVGWRRNPQGCPLTFFLAEHGYDVLGVNTDCYVLRVTPETLLRYALPPWAQRFLASVDTADGEGEQPLQICAAEALAALMTNDIDPCL